MEKKQFENGLLIEDFIVYDKDEPILIKSIEGGKLQVNETYCGDHSMWHIVQYDKNGDEVSRYNLKYVASFTLK